MIDAVPHVFRAAFHWRRIAAALIGSAGRTMVARSARRALRELSDDVLEETGLTRDDVLAIAHTLASGSGHSISDAIVSPSTLKRWAKEKIVPVRNGRWTRAAAAQARVVARMRERGYPLEDVRDAARRGSLAFGYAESLFKAPGGEHTREEVAAETGLEPDQLTSVSGILDLIERERPA